MKKGILIVCMACGLFLMGMAQEPLGSVEKPDSVEMLDSLVVDSIVEMSYIDMLDPSDTVAILNVLDSLYQLDSLNLLVAMSATLITEDMPRAVVHQDSTITRLMRDKRVGYVRGEQTKDGFRVQIYASNQQQKAKTEATELQQRIEQVIEVPIYTISEPPFWKVRIGNFENRDDANQYKNVLLKLFPELTSSTYVVPDKIIMLQ